MVQKGVHAAAAKREKGLKLRRRNQSTLLGSAAAAAALQNGLRLRSGQLRPGQQRSGQQQHGAGDELCQQVGVQRLVVDCLAVQHKQVGLDLVGNITY